MNDAFDCIPYHVDAHKEIDYDVECKPVHRVGNHVGNKIGSDV